jgi:hypothetical protein
LSTTINERWRSLAIRAGVTLRVRLDSRTIGSHDCCHSVCASIALIDTQGAAFALAVMLVDAGADRSAASTMRSIRRTTRSAAATHCGYTNSVATQKVKADGL